jgi:Zn-dependent M28 family amino/carboxypeptidase
MKGNLSFLSSDLLEGRATPSKGLDLAAEFIACQFRRFGLQPLGDDGYFQTATFPKGKVRNVIGMLQGSDPKLKSTYILLTAHYDHLGVNPNLKGDKIFNGADDDGSGVVSVIELADAFSRLPQHPKRSLIFMCFWGEELGLLGSRYYGEHPAVPIKDTIADLNLEQVGRTDDIEGPRVSELSMTGFDYSDLGSLLNQAASKVGVKITKHPQYSDAYFERSDNQALADLGVPAHTLCAAFEFPDYHLPGDEWQKIDYLNMARVDRALALGLFQLANSPRKPAWNAEISATLAYRAAQKAAPK